MSNLATFLKELRQRTNAGIMDCKKALEESAGDLEKAILWLREKGIVKAAKKAGSIAAEGIIQIAKNNEKQIMFELNSQTDFAAKNSVFENAARKITKILLENNFANFEEALKTETNDGSLENICIDATSQIGEKINLRRYVSIPFNKENATTSYLHFNQKIGVILVLQGTKDNEVAHEIAMHASAMRPLYLQREDIPQSKRDEEEKIIEEQISNSDENVGKKPEIMKKMIAGKLNKELNNLCLLEQAFFKNPKLKIKEVLKKANATIKEYVRYEVGEGIEKNKISFAEEVELQRKNIK